MYSKRFFSLIDYFRVSYAKTEFLCGSASWTLNSYDYMQVYENLRIVQGCKAPGMQSGFYDKGNDLNNFTKIGWSNEREANRKEK